MKLSPNRHPIDTYALISVIASGGLSAVFAFIAHFIAPTHEAEINGISISLISLAVALRTIYNATPRGALPTPAADVPAPSLASSTITL